MNPPVAAWSSYATVKICRGKMHQLRVNCLLVLDGRLMHPSEELR